VAGDLVTAGFQTASALCSASLLPGRSRLLRSSRLLFLFPPGQTAVPNLSRLLPFLVSRRWSPSS
jgi:hypothetical protein